MILEFRQIRKSFGGKEILHGINFRVESGRAMGFLGRNGAGKSTTFRCLMQVFRQDSGEFLLDGQPFNPNRHRIGYLPEERGMYSKSTLESQLMYFSQLKGASRKQSAKEADYWLRYFSLSEYHDKKLEILSKGNQQKVQIAQAFLNDPDIIILDEPFSGLDPVNAQVFKDAIREMVERGKLVIFSSHQMSYVEELCDDITLIDKGTVLLSGSLEKIRAEKGHNTFVIECRPEAAGKIEQLSRDAGIFLSRKSSRIFTKRDETALKELLGNAFDDILSCGLWRPSLQEIFIEEAGEEAGHEA
ncbi:MAG: ABC transporter ATP-binding protein [Lachnospiraceae bacterium]|jgi:ABC-2 type transport system ATP-binding protein